MERIEGLRDEDWNLAEVLAEFSNKYLLERYDDPKPTPECHIEWWALFLSDQSQVAIAAPRGHAKSTAITFAFAMFIFVYRVTRHLLLIGSNEDLASSFLNDIKIELQENDALRKDFGIKAFKKDSESELIVQFHDGIKSRILAKGAGQRMRGLKWERKRPDYVLFDDMEDEEMVLNEGRRKKFREWFYGAVRPIVRAGGKIRGVGTIIGYDSFLERTMPSEKSKETVIEPLRTHSTKPSGWFSVKYRAHDPEYRELLWPEQFSEESLKAIRKEYAEMGMLDIYGQEYLNDPIDESQAYFRTSDFLPMKDTDQETRKSYYAAVDLAIGETERNAFSVIMVGGLDADGFLNIVDVRRGRWDGLQIVEELFSVQSRWDIECFRVESENIAKSIGSFLFREMDERQEYLNIDDRPPTKDKDKRARSIQARTRAGKVKFDKEADWYPDLEEELSKYPKFAYKDQFDAFAWLGLMLEEMVNPLTDEEEAEVEYQEQYYQHMPTGRCAYTGYIFLFCMLSSSLLWIL